MSHKTAILRGLIVSIFFGLVCGFMLRLEDTPPAGLMLLTMVYPFALSFAIALSVHGIEAILISFVFALLTIGLTSQLTLGIRGADLALILNYWTFGGITIGAIAGLVYRNWVRVKDQP